MTEKKIKYAHDKIKACKLNGFAIEALLRGYHLNVELIKYMLLAHAADYSMNDKKIKVIVNDFLDEITVNPKLKAILNKKNLKTVKPWLQKMDQYFKILKHRRPYNTKSMLEETEKVFTLLHISISKLFAQKKPQKAL